MPSSFRLYLLGGFHLENAGHPIALARRKAASLLAYLALNPEAHAREKLAALFWGDSTDADARRVLRVTLTDLRRVLGEEAFLGGRDTLQLNPAFPLWVDANDFVHLEDWQLDQGLAPLKALLALYQGDLLPDDYDDWVVPRREALRALYVSGLLLGASALRSQSEYAQVIEFARKILAVEPGQEQAYQHLMFCHATLGDRSALQQDFADCQRALRDELGVESSKETRALYERLLQQTEAGSPAARLTNLPRPLTSFVGRGTELRSIVQLLDPDDSNARRLLTLTGAGGSGKTRLAIQVGHDLLTHYPDGVWWVDLSSLIEGGLIAQQVAQALGVPEQVTQPDRLRTLSDYLQARKLLLLLDNCEHLLATCAALAERLLAQAPALQILATSREPLGLAGEHIFQTPTLSVPPAEQALNHDGSLLAYEAIKLFVDRATARLPAFHLTEQNAARVAQICRRLDGIPLALELTAAEVSALSLAEIAARLEKRLDLAHPGTAGPSRQQTLHALIGWSYDLLNEAEQTLFRRLAVFVGGWTLEQAVVIAGGYTQGGVSLAAQDSTVQLPVTGAMIVQALLNGLAEKSLLQLRQTEKGGRYSMLEMIREYAQACLAADEANVIQRRHYTFFTQFADSAHLAVQSSDSETWLARVEADHDNLRAALSWAVVQDRSADTPSGLSPRLAGALWTFWHHQGYILEGETWLTRALETVNNHPQPTDPAESKAWDRNRARVLTGLGTMAWIKGEHQRAEDLHRQALALFKQAGDVRAIAMTLNNTATACMDAGRYVEAAHLLNEGLGLARGLEDAHPAVFILVSLGSVDQHLGNFDLAREHYTEALQLSRAQGLKTEACLAQNNLGDIVMWQGDLTTALKHYAESLAIAREMGIKLLISANLIFSALALYLAGRIDESQANCQAALQMSLDTVYKAQIVECLVILGLLAEKQGQWERAVRLLSAATANRDQIHYTFYPVMQAPYEAGLAALRAQQPLADFEMAWAESQTLTLQAALAL